jgi:DNA modification methylase
MADAKVLRGDCRAIMRGLDAGSIDAIVTDPPYGIDFQSASRTDKDARYPKIANDNEPFISWLPDAVRLLKNDGALICFCRWDVQEAFRAAIEAAGLTVRSQIVWDRQHHGSGNLTAAFAPQHDVAWFATKGRFSFPGKRPRSVISVPRVAWQSAEHPTEKPVELMRQLVRAVTPPRGTVLDPFTGSGSTGSAAVLEGFQFIGAELSAEYAAIARRRIKAAQTEQCTLSSAARALSPASRAIPAAGRERSAPCKNSRASKRQPRSRPSSITSRTAPGRSATRLRSNSSTAPGARLLKP